MYNLGNYFFVFRLIYTLIVSVFAVAKDKILGIFHLSCCRNRIYSVFFIFPVGGIESTQYFSFFRLAEWNLLSIFHFSGWRNGIYSVFFIFPVVGMESTQYFSFFRLAEWNLLSIFRFFASSEKIKT